MMTGLSLSLTRYYRNTESMANFIEDFEINLIYLTLGAIDSE